MRAQNIIVIKLQDKPYQNKSIIYQIFMKKSGSFFSYLKQLTAQPTTINAEYESNQS
ncbi:hypothetical protein [Acinetobacter gyllenbergii]|uniref:hypothetical protein n=1 Tax=Acinetobacter gyllenbergii TaxID=134534 RepID=UPI003F5744D7